MSANIPFEVQEEIIKRVVDVKPLLRLRSVSKTWKSFIDSSEFITYHHHVNQNHPHHLLLKYRADRQDKYVSVVDDASFPHNKIYHVVPHAIKLVEYALMFDCSHGLVCLYGLYSASVSADEYLIVIWNPSIRKSVVIRLPPRLIAIGFGVCPKTYDPKVVKITIDWKVEVFTLSTGAWRSISMNLPLKPIRFNPKQVVLNGVIYWITFKTDPGSDDLIIWFDLISEEFGEIALPDGVSESSDLFIYKLNESLVLFDHNEEALVFDVWMMTKDDESKKLFVKLFTRSCDNSLIYHIIGFRMNGQSIMIQTYVDDDDDENPEVTLKVYDPSSKHMNDFDMEANALYDFCKMTSYTESLLMLNQPNIIFQ